jgi:hypothetical protein
MAAVRMRKSSNLARALKATMDVSFNRADHR